MTVAELLDIVTKGGVIGLLLLITVGGWRRWYVWRWAYDEAIAERDWWRTMALRGTALAEKAADVATTHS
jgi:hypothetical protein